MSAGTPRGREVAHRVFAAEFRDATYAYTRSDEERAPKYVVSPTGAQINRLFIVGVLTTVERVNEETVRARIVDPTGAFVVYASQYQPDARAHLESIDPPAFVAVTGKANTFQPEGSDRIYSSVRPEAIALVDEDTRDRWSVQTAERTLGRLAMIAKVMRDGGEPASGIAIAIERYDPSPAYLAQLYSTCIDTLRLVAGEIETLEIAELRLTADGEPAVSLDRIVETASAIGDATSPEDAAESLDTEGDSPADPAAESVDPLSPPSPETATAESPETGEEAGGGEPDESPEPVLTDDERASVEAEFGTAFTTGDEFDRPADTSDDEAVDRTAEPEEPQSTEPANDLEREGSASDQIVTLLDSLDEGDGVERGALVEAAADRLAFDAHAVDEALEAALLAGRCYEADTDVFKAI